MIRHLFVVTSAINSRFGVFSPAERLEQTLMTIKSIRNKVPDAGIAIMECTGISPTAEQEAVLRENCDWFLDYTADPDVQSIYTSTDNWDIVKNGTEIMCFGRALQVLSSNNIVQEFDRIHKMSGRYVLNDYFDTNLYEPDIMQEKVIIGPSHDSQFPYHMTQVERQYMARLWSWPLDMHDVIVKSYIDSFDYFNQRILAGGYVDIEHVLYKFLPKDHIVEVPMLGVEGSIAPNGIPIKN